MKNMGNAKIEITKRWSTCSTNEKKKTNENNKEIKTTSKHETQKRYSALCVSSWLIGDVGKCVYTFL